MATKPEPQSFRRFLASTPVERTDSFVYDGVEFNFAAVPDGEAYIGVMFPDPQAALTASKHAATVNGRLMPNGDLRPYPVEIYGDVIAILNTYRIPSSEAPPDIVEVFALYDANPELFCLMRGSALEVIGVGGGSMRANSGIGAWTAIFGATAKAHQLLSQGSADEARKIVADAFQVARAALSDFKLNPKDALGEIVKLDPELEALLGN
ncbi:hypothetical protein [Caudoviricetes sp.]|nr:hypothetical protein [Caudoviricetes sp.]